MALRAGYKGIKKIGRGLSLSTDGVLSSTGGGPGGETALSDLSDVSIISPSDGQLLQYDATSQKWVNESGAVIPSKTVTVYSAASDTLTYSDLTGTKTVTTDANGVGTANIVCADDASITFTSSVAKNPSDLSANYSKTVNVTSSTTAVYVMPNDDVLYWYGYKGSNLEDISTANGWTGTTFIAPTYNTNNVRLSSSAGNLSGIGNKNVISRITKLCTICQGITMAGGHCGVLVCKDNKETNGATEFSTITNTDIAYKEISTSYRYVFMDSESGRVSDIYALWYE